MDKAARIIRIITVAPIMAIAALSILFGLKPEIFGGVFQYIISVIFLTVFPLLAYPLQPIIPSLSKKGRDGQRKLAIIMAVCGYLFGIISALCFNAPKTIWLIYLTYFISGIGIALFNKALKIRASGHACGVVGPIALLIYFLGAWGLIGAVIIIPVFWACIKMKRHTLPQLIWGSIIPIAAFLLSLLLILLLKL
jgi:MFS family permease